MDLLAELEARISGMSPEKKRDLDRMLAPELSAPWRPNPGPQTEALRSQADLLLYGGAAGGGKTDLIAGLALTEHRRSVVFRQQAEDLRGFWDRLLELSPVNQQKDSNLKRLTTTDGRLIETGHLGMPGSERAWQGRPHDLVAFDEGAQIAAAKVAFVLGWLRSASDGKAQQRCRAIIATNPPIGGDGDWLLEWFAPWLDPLYPLPARPGELRWAIIEGRGDEILTRWVDGPDPVRMADGEWQKPLSRTFIPSKLDDNPYLRDTGYRAQIASMPEPLRSQLLKGDFLAAREDHADQVIPTEWVEAAQARWSPEGRQRQMLTMGVDVAQGGADQTTVAKLHAGAWFDEIVSLPGSETPDGASVASLIIRHRREGAVVGIDTTGGWGGAAREHLKTHQHLDAHAIVFSAESHGRDAASGLGYANLRAEMFWEFRNALNPANREQVALPPGGRLKAQLTALRWKLRGTDILIESKDDIRKRLRTSTDEADAIVMAWKLRRRALLVDRDATGRPVVKSTRAKLGHSAIKDRYRR